MKEIVYNSDNLKDSDINDIVVRTKALIINGNNILLGNESGRYQFIGGHLENGESFSECLIREIKEESGIELSLSEIGEPFFKIIYLNKDYPKVGINRKNEIYYYLVKTNKLPNLDNTCLTENEKYKNYKVEVVLLDCVIQFLKDNILDNEKNYIVSRDMILVLEEYFKRMS